MKPSLRVSAFLFLVACAPRAVAPAAPEVAVDADPATIVVPESLEVPLPVDPKVHHGVLDNGIGWYVEPNGRPAGRAELRLVVKAGSLLEDESQRGLAHFVEHMAFNGSEHFPPGTLVNYLESIGMQFGADVNAYTSFDETVYKLQVPTDDPELLESGFVVMRDWAMGLTFDREECEKERGVVLEEWRLGEGLGERIRAATLPLAFKGSRYLDRLPIGTGESLPAFDCADAERFWRDWYRPELMTVLAVGDFDAGVVEGLVAEHLGEVPASGKPKERPYYPIPGHAEPEVLVFSDPELTSSGVSLMDKVDDVEGSTHAAYRTFLLEQLVFLAANERVGVLSQDPAAPFYGMGLGTSELGHQRAAQTFGVGPKEGRELESLTVLGRELQRLKTYGLTSGELARARAALEGSMRDYYEGRHKTDSGTHVDELLRVVLTGEPMPGIPYEYALSQAYLPDIDVEEANAWIEQSFFPGDGRVIQVLVPAREGREVPTEAEVVAALQAGFEAPTVAPEDVVADGALIESPPAPGASTLIRGSDLLDASLHELSNGAQLWIKTTDFEEDVFLFAGVRPGGTAVLSDELFPSALSAPGIAVRSGVGEFDPVTLQRMLAGKGAIVYPSLVRWYEGLSGGGRARDAETAMQLLHLYVTEPRFDADVLAREKEARLEAIANADASPRPASTAPGPS